ncbi:unnamed protein product [Periconia digitata]|uniref:Uncharacterized protein n=1 Tax=Periconia digitata TaxID=1303443 RepID=A0A9W4XJS7_9PLEO|nr:unnamed protein product [Periconia digitata]
MKMGLLFDGMDYKKEVGYFRSLHDEKSRYAQDVIRTRKQLPKTAKDIDRIKANMLQKPPTPRAENRLRELEREYTDLTAHFEASQRNYITAGQNIEVHISDFMKPSSLALCAGMMTRLPRELRDQIYETVLILVWKERRQGWFTITHEHQPNVHFLMKEKPWDDDDALPIYPITLPDYRDVAPSHLWNEGYVGLDVRKELVEAFYRTGRFCLDMCQQRKNFKIDEFLTDDVWNTGIKPYDFVSRVYIDYIYTPYVECVTKFRKNSQIAILLKLRAFQWSMNMSRRLLSHVDHSLLQPCRELREAGYKVLVFIDGIAVDLDKGMDPAKVPEWVQAHDDLRSRYGGTLD